MVDVIPSAESLTVTERTISSPAEVDNLDWTSVEFLQFGPQGPTIAEVGVSEMDQMASQARRSIVSDPVGVMRPFVRTGLASKKSGASVVAQARVLQALGQTDPQERLDTYGVPGETGSNQLNLEDFLATLDFIPIPRGIRLELYEQQMFEENHITGTCLTRLASAITRRGWEFSHYKEDSLSDEEVQDDNELETLETWVDNANSVSGFREIVEHTGAEFQATSNAYIEVIRAEFDPKAAPAGLEKVISSTMRIIRGHRGFVQWLYGQFRWFNNYTPSVEDRVAGVALWEQYWKDRGIDTASDDFLNGPWARTMNSAMPKYAFNPYLTEIMHLKDLSMSSVYYGFPKDYRLGKLDALLQHSLDYNIALQKNSRIPPFCILFHGKMTPEDRKDIQNYFASLKGADNWGNVPILQAPGMGGQMQGASKSGLEIVKIAGEDKDGMFLGLWERAIKDIAMHYGIPLDLLTTENSNRATVTEAAQIFNENTVGRFHQILEDKLKKLTKDDLGCQNRYLHFIDLDTDDQLDKANEAKLWHDIGVLCPNEIRKIYLGLPARPGGDQYFGAMVMPEDEVSEMTNTSRAMDMQTDPAKLEAAKAAASTPAGQQTGGDSQEPNQQSPVAQNANDVWDYLVRRYG